MGNNQDSIATIYGLQSLESHTGMRGIESIQNKTKQNGLQLHGQPPLVHYLTT